MRALVCVAAALLSAHAARAQCSPAHPTLCELPARSDLEQPNLERAVDIVLVGDGFTDLDDWHAVAADHIAAIRERQQATRVYASLAGVYNFHVVDVASQTNEVADDDLRDTALGARATGRELITADQFRAALAALAAPDVDVVYLIVNTDAGRANATFPSTLASGGTVRMPRDPRPASHELGHAVMRLADEYIEDQFCQGGGEIAAWHIRNVTADPLCYRWSDVDGAQCIEGNVYCRRGFYRAAPGCLMRASGNTAPCPVCRDTMERTLLQRRTLTDHADPWPAIELPPEGAEVRGRIQVRTWVWDDYIINSEVFLELDGAVVDRAPTNPWAAETTLDTRALANGPHTLVAVAVDEAGHDRRSLPRTFVVANGLADEAAVIELVAPQPESEVVRPRVAISARATDAQGQPAVNVELMSAFIDGVLVGAQGGGALDVQWNASRADLGAHVLEVTARTHGQITSTTGPVALTLVSQGGEVPDLVVVEPRPWDAVGPFFVLRYLLSGVLPGGQAELFMDGNRVGPLPIPSPNEEALVVVDASDWALGAHELGGRLNVGPFRFDAPPLPVVRVAPEVPWVRLVDPPEAVAGDWSFEALAVAPAPITSVTLHAAGLGVVARAVGERVVLEWHTDNVDDGCADVWAEVRDEAGGHAFSDVVEVCVHNEPPAPVIVSPADGAAVAAGALAVHVRLETDAPPLRVEHWLEVIEDGAVVGRIDDVFDAGFVTVELGAGVHELRVRARNAFDAEGTSPPIRVRADACAGHAVCTDDDPCTDDVCTFSGLCLNTPRAGCCDEAGDCDDGDPCTADACGEGRCAHERVEGCCNHAADCPDDGDPCTIEVCPEPGGACAVTDGPCCADDAGCDDGDRCTADSCLAGFAVCTNDRDPDCCAEDGDCDDGDPCTEELCRNGACVRDGPHAGCCRVDFECEDGAACTTARCVAGACRQTRVPGCCVEDGDCRTLDPCAQVRCVVEAQRCEEVPTEGCCVFDSQCDDEDVCTIDACVEAACQHTHNCCVEPADCDDGDLCTAERCVDGYCAPEPIDECCHADADCDDGDVCTTEACAESACVREAVAGCCNLDAECGDGDPCTVGVCADHACRAAPVEGCCSEDGECDDLDVCTVDRCVDNACSAADVPGCCNEDRECDDGDACTISRCVDHLCASERVFDCCNFDQDCLDDGDPCTYERCVQHGCVFEPVVGCGLPDAARPDAVVGDAAVGDAARADHGPDGDLPDVYRPDVGALPDAHRLEAAVVDAPTPDALVADAGSPDTVARESGPDEGASPLDEALADAVVDSVSRADAADVGGGGDEGCSCGPAPRSGLGGWWWCLLLLRCRRRV